MYHKTKKRWFLLSLTGLLLAALLLGGCSQSSGSIIEGGSSTVQPLADKWSKAFEAQNPQIKITVQGGGSSAGVKGCAQGVLDIGAASRELKSSETSQWPDLVVTHVAADGVAIVVHPSNNTADLTLEEVRNIFATGSNATWTVINREEGSGTREVFEKKVMAGTEVAAGGEFLPSNGAVKQKVASTPSAIGYISLGYVDASVKALSIGGIVCTKANCVGGSYPVTRYLNFITNGKPKGLAKKFIDFCLSTEGQKIVDQEGYISLK
ncbi:MAG: phosphate ABC transporter substrate-binding protein [Dehalococcoidales bacterium]|nr:phosphate ABC transporter substrate-binding protein [Dehalococcoidales bacterium]